MAGACTPFHLPRVCSISRSSASLASLSSAVGPVPILCSLGAVLAPPMKLAKLAGPASVLGPEPWPASA